MEITLFLIAAILIIGGVVGSILPGLPGPPLGYFGMLALQATDKIQFSHTFLIISGVVVIAVTIVDYFIPAWMTNRFGGTRYGERGSMIGMIIGMFFTAIGIVLGTLVGAVVGELMGGMEWRSALRSGFSAFVGLLLSTGIKLMVSMFFVAQLVISIIR